MRRIDAGLAADRGIDLRQQRCGNLDETHAPPQAGGGKAGEVADHAAAERDQKIAALHARCEGRLAKLSEMGVILGRFARGQHEMVMAHARRIEARLQGREPARANIASR